LPASATSSAQSATSSDETEQTPENPGNWWAHLDRTLPFRTLLHTRKNREVAKKNKPSAIFLLETLFQTSLARAVLEPKARDRLGSRLYISMAKR
jgi:hypothetical protein